MCLYPLLPILVRPLPAFLESHTYFSRDIDELTAQTLASMAKAGPDIPRLSPLQL